MKHKVAGGCNGQRDKGSRVFCYEKSESMNNNEDAVDDRERDVIFCLQPEIIMLQYDKKECYRKADEIKQKQQRKYNAHFLCVVASC
jgi:hypothetical protein